MFTPHRSTSAAPNLANANQSTDIVVTLQFSGHSVTVTHDGFTLGSSHQCDLVLNDSATPGLHSIIHMQSGAIWIEVAGDDRLLMVNDRPYRRMALRHEDRVKIGTTEFQFLMKNAMTSELADAPLTEDLSLLTAEELCDRIMSEQSMVEEFIQGQRSGWEALLEAIQSANDQQPLNNGIDNQPADSTGDRVDFDHLLEQIQELNESVKDHTRELSDHEKEVLESTSIMEESQKRAVQQLDEIIEKLKNSEPPNGLRASA